MDKLMSWFLQKIILKNQSRLLTFLCSVANTSHIEATILDTSPKDAFGFWPLMAAWVSRKNSAYAETGLWWNEKMKTKSVWISGNFKCAIIFDFQIECKGKNLHHANGYNERFRTQELKTFVTLSSLPLHILSL